MKKTTASSVSTKKFGTGAPVSTAVPTPTGATGTGVTVQNKKKMVATKRKIAAD
jgi:hypothetical protein